VLWRCAAVALCAARTCSSALVALDTLCCPPPWLRVRAQVGVNVRKPPYYLS
jgi:hypothetical protein